MFYLNACDPLRFHNTFFPLPPPSSLTAEDFAIFFEEINKLCSSFPLTCYPALHYSHLSAVEICSFSCPAVPPLFHSVLSHHKTPDSTSQHCLTFITSIVNGSLTSRHYKMAFVNITEKLHVARSSKWSSTMILIDLSAATDILNHKAVHPHSTRS